MTLVERPFAAYQGNEPYIFVSYAHDDAAYVYPEIVHLRDQGFNIWYDEGIRPGASWRDEVALALTQCKLFLFFASPRSVASTNCLKEVNFSLSRERKIIVVHLEKTQLPIGLELSLSDMQAILREDHSEAAYQTKLANCLSENLPQKFEHVVVGRDLIEPNLITTAAGDKGKSIAILPFDNRSNDPDNEFLCEGIADELINGLSQVEGLKVASQLASFKYKKSDLDLSQIGQKLGVKHILNGSVQKVGDRVRITVQLSQVDNGSMLWSSRLDKTLADIFALQEEVATQVVSKLEVSLGADQNAPLVDVGTDNAQAYEQLLLGNHLFRRHTQRSLEQALSCYQRAVAFDPEFGPAYMNLHVCYRSLVSGFGAQRSENIARAEKAADRARETGYKPKVPWIVIHRRLHPEAAPGQRSSAIEACTKIREPDPEWQLHEFVQLSASLTAAGLFRGSLDYLEHYYRQSKQQPTNDNTYCWLLGQIGQFDQAILASTESIAERPDDPIPIGDRAMLYSRTGQYTKAAQDLENMAKTLPRNFPAFYHLFWLGELDAATEYFNWLESRNMMTIYKFWGCFLLGEFERGMNHLEATAAQGFGASGIRLNATRVLPASISRAVVDHPRFKNLMAQYGVDDGWYGELMDMANKLTDITGIVVRPDEDY